MAETASHCCSVIGVDTERSRRHWCCDEMAGTVRASSGRKAFSQCILARREVNQCVFTADDVRLSGLGTNIQAGPFSQTVLVTPVNLSLRCTLYCHTSLRDVYPISRLNCRQYDEIGGEVS